MRPRPSLLLTATLAVFLGVRTDASAGVEALPQRLENILYGVAETLGFRAVRFAVEDRAHFLGHRVAVVVVFGEHHRERALVGVLVALVEREVVLVVVHRPWQPQEVVYHVRHPPLVLLLWPQVRTPQLASLTLLFFVLFVFFGGLRALLGSCRRLCGGVWVGDSIIVFWRDGLAFYEAGKTQDLLGVSPLQEVLQDVGDRLEFHQGKIPK